MLAAHRVKHWATTLWPGLPYRLSYNAVALLTALPLAVWMTTVPGPLFWAWNGIWAWLANAAAALAVGALVWRGAGYDWGHFLGLTVSAQPEQRPRLVLSTWHRYVRHPWYCVGLVVIWTRDMSAAMLVTASMASLYFWWGSRLEERKLVLELGPAYARYRTLVPALFPLPWKCLTETEAEALMAEAQKTMSTAPGNATQC